MKKSSYKDYFNFRNDLSIQAVGLQHLPDRACISIKGILEYIHIYTLAVLNRVNKQSLLLDAVNYLAVSKGWFSHINENKDNLTNLITSLREPNIFFIDTSLRSATNAVVEHIIDTHLSISEDSLASFIELPIQGDIKIIWQ